MNFHDKLLKEYIVVIDDLVGYSGRLLRIPNAQAPFWLVAYDDVPERESVTAFTFGISFVQHPSWVSGVPEIVISVNSTDDDWLLSLGAIACSLRGKCPFTYGNVLRFGKPLCRETEMSSYFLFWPTILEKDQQRFQISDRLIILKQAYPIFESEADAIGKAGAEELFMRDGVDYTDVSRQKVI